MNTKKAQKDKNPLDKLQLNTMYGVVTGDIDLSGCYASGESQPITDGKKI